MFRFKKHLIALFGSVLVLFLVACGGDTPPAAPPAEEEIAVVEQPAEVEEEMVEETMENVTITIESWRNDDLAIWQDSIIPAFNKQHPNIEVIFAPSAPTEYDGALNTKLEGGTAGDLITCRPFDRSLALFDAGHLASLNDLEGMANFGGAARSAWITDDGSDTFCVPMASVIHGFIYNADMFAEAGVEAPETVEDFFAVMDTLQAAGITPLDMGTADQWEAATMGFQNIGPNYWNGEEGRLALLSGEARLTDPEYVAVWEQLSRWGQYMPSGFEAQTYPDSQNLFTLGQAAIYPAGSWDISLFDEQADFAMGAFKPPVQNAGDTCYISDHTDIAIGMNANTPHPEAVKTFLNWVASAEFANLFSNALPGFYSLADVDLQIENPLAAEFVNWRGECESTIRNSYQILSRGEPNLENELWRVSAQVINGDITPEEAGQQTQDGLDKWYAPSMEAAAAGASAMAEDEGEMMAGGDMAGAVTIESWRNDDLAIWQDLIIPAFNAHFPNIEVNFAPSAPTEYDGALNTKLEGGTAGDLITCRPFDRSLALFDAGHLASLNDLEGMANFGGAATSAWITDDGSDVFCVPMASVIHGFIYNADLFAEAGVEVPETVDDFFAVMDTLQAAGITPLDMGTADQWEAATMGFQNIGPNYWGGEEGRLALISGEGKLTDQAYVDTLAQLARWGEYMPSGFQAQTYPDSQNLFTLGQAAIYPAGSWDISLFNSQADFAMGAFKPPVQNAGDECYISDHTDIAIGLNANAADPEAAKAFLNWAASAEFANLFSNALPGFYSLANVDLDIEDPLAAEFVEWRGECQSTIRNSYQILSRGEPNLENELWRVSAQVINGDITAEDGAAQLQEGLDAWYNK
ncbi:MAG: raffinose/stachyose/melibiose transport system substrate-binding protein [Cellvibrionaceae bacterium]|jgi:raffinose/stachyose/melibiose transport system substrate-binding protein